MTHDEMIEAVAKALVASDGGPIPEIRSWHRRYARAAIRVIAPAVLEEAREAWTDNWYDFQDHIDALKTRYEQ